MKVGDKLYCHTSNGFNSAISIGGVYTVKDICRQYTYRWGLTIYFINDIGNSDWVSFDSDSFWCYSNWFYTLSELRKEKLDELGRSSLI